MQERRFRREGLGSIIHLSRRDRRSYNVQMNPAIDQQDTIVAIATPPGRGGIGVLRLSGPEALDIAKKIVRPDLTIRPRFAHFTAFHDDQGEIIDEGLMLAFPAPHSFTGENVVELQGHGGPVLLDMLIRTCVHHGARLARAGEFSMRAFLNDRVDLAQAEAIADLIDAGSESAARAAFHSLQGEFSARINQLVEQLIQLRMYVEAAIDFPEEEIDFLSDSRVSGDLDNLIQATHSVIDSARQGRLIREGMNLVIAGRPNAGKSSLLNALAGHDAAIVTDVPGTTRDLLRESIQLDGLPLNIIDTAGLRESPDRVEQEGIRRAWAEIGKADHVLVVADSCELTLPVDDINTLLPEGQKTLSELPFTLVLNKSDLSGLSAGLLADASPMTAIISATTGEGMDALKGHLKTLAGYQDVTGHRFTARRRHIHALETALAAMTTGRDQLQAHRAGELLAEDLRSAQHALEEIIGVFSADDLLGRIFSSFCIGK